MHSNTVDLSFSIFGAYYQAGMLFAGLAALAVGIFCLGDFLYWRLHAEKVRGRITSVRQDGKFTYPVYHFTLASGQSHDATSSIGTGIDSTDYASTLNATGDVDLMVFPENPEIVRPVHGVAANLLLIGAILCGVVGFTFVVVACTHYPFTKYTALMLLGFSVYGVTHARRILFPQGKAVPFSQWKNLAAAKQRASLSDLPVRPIAEARVKAEEAGQDDAKQKLRNNMPTIRKFHKVLLGATFLFFFLAVLNGYKIAQLDLAGARTEGAVVSIDRVWNSGTHNSSGHYDYFPIVTFKTVSGEDIRFKDQNAWSEKSHKIGDQVPVLYLENAPDGARIDLGIRNWFGPLPLIFCGLILLFFAHKTSDAYVGGVLNQGQPASAGTRSQVRIVLLVGAPAILVLSVFLGFQTIKLTENGVRVQGTVQSLHGQWSQANSHRSTYTYHAVVDFITPGQQHFQFEDRTGSNPPMYSVGEAVSVLYLPETPDTSAVIDHGKANWIVPGVLLLLSLGLGVVGLRMRPNPRTL